jgi:hypothetical protein
MPAIGDTQVKFDRTYIWLKGNPNAPGAWRLTGNDNTPGANQDQSKLEMNGTVASSRATIAANQLVYINSAGAIDLADASAIATGRVAGAAIADAIANGPITYARNMAVNVINPTVVIDGAPSVLETGKYYYLSATTPGNYTRTPDTSTTGAVLVQVGLALDTANMTIEIQEPLVI